MASLNVTAGSSVFQTYLPWIDLSSYKQDKITILDMSNITIGDVNYTGDDKKIEVDLDNAFIASLLSYVKIGVDLMIGFFLALIIYRVLR